MLQIISKRSKLTKLKENNMEKVQSKFYCITVFKHILHSSRKLEIYHRLFSEFSNIDGLNEIANADEVLLFSCSAYLY